jgi:hypothetical protein
VVIFCLLDCHTGFSLGVLDPEDGGNMFLRNVSLLSTDYQVLHPRRRKRSRTILTYNLWSSFYNLFHLHVAELELEFILRPTVSRPVSLGIGPPFGTLNQILSCSSFVWQLRRSAFNASSLTRKRICNLLYNYFWALPEQSHLSRSPTELTAISYCLLWDSSNLEGQVPVFISPRNRVAQLYPRALGFMLLLLPGIPIYCHVVECLQPVFGLVIGFIELPQNVTSNNRHSLSEFHAPKMS